MVALVVAFAAGCAAAEDVVVAAPAPRLARTKRGAVRAERVAAVRGDEEGKASPNRGDEEESEAVRAHLADLDAQRLALAEAAAAAAQRVTREVMTKAERWR